MLSSLHAQTVFNGYVSQIRNMFTISSIALAVMVFSDRFVAYKHHIKLIAVSIVIFSIFYGYTASRDFNSYLKFIDKQNTLTELDVLLLSQWRFRLILSYIYIFLLIILTAIIITQKEVIIHTNYIAINKLIGINIRNHL